MFDYFKLFDIAPQIAWEVAELCEADLSSAENDCDVAYKAWKSTRGNSKRLRAKAEYHRKRAVYWDKLATYYDFYKE